MTNLYMSNKEGEWENWTYEQFCRMNGSDKPWPISMDAIVQRADE
jgi:hypothetical protein